MFMVLQIEMSQDSDDVFTFHCIVPQNIKISPSRRNYFPSSLLPICLEIPSKLHTYTCYKLFWSVRIPPPPYWKFQSLCVGTVNIFSETAYGEVAHLQASLHTWDGLFKGRLKLTQD